MPLNIHPRIALRFALVALVAISRCVHVMVEQPRSSVMMFLDHYMRAAKRLGEDLWGRVNLSIPQSRDHILASKSAHVTKQWFRWNQTVVMSASLSICDLSWMATWGHDCPKPTMVFGTAFGTKILYARWCQDERPCCCSYKQVYYWLEIICACISALLEHDRNPFASCVHEHMSTWENEPLFKLQCFTVDTCVKFNCLMILTI